MQVFAVHYVYDPVAADRRAELLEQHRDWLRAIEQECRLVAAGMYPDGSGAHLIILNEHKDAMSAELARDPFVRAALIERVDVRAWLPTWGPVGEIAAKAQ